MRDTSPRYQVGGVAKQQQRFEKYFSVSQMIVEQPTLYKLNRKHRKQVCLDDVGDFPQNIAEFYWIYCNPAEDKFYGLCRLHCGLYAYFRLVEYGINEFLEERRSKVITSTSREELIEYAMSSNAYKKYLKKTTGQSA